MNGNVRHVEEDGVAILEGKTVMNLYAEKADSTKYYITLEMTELNVEEFDEDTIILKGRAHVDYQKTKQGIWFCRRTGPKDPED